MRVDRFHPLLLAPALALVFAAGCGGGGSSSDSSQSAQAADIALKDEAAAKAKKAADKVVRATPDKNIPGPKRYLAVCLRRGDPDAAAVPPGVVQCHVQAFYENYRGRPGGYIWSENWQVPIQNGKLGTPVIAGEYRIRNFLREDNKRNCVGRHRSRECLPQSLGGVLPG